MEGWGEDDSLGMYKYRKRGFPYRDGDRLAGRWEGGGGLVFNYRWSFRINDNLAVGSNACFKNSPVVFIPILTK